MSVSLSGADLPPPHAHGPPRHRPRDHDGPGRPGARPRVPASRRAPAHRLPGLGHHRGARHGHVLRHVRLGRQAAAHDPHLAHHHRPGGLPVRQLDVALGLPRVRADRAGAVLGSQHTRRHPGPGRRPRHQRGRHPQQLGHPGPLGPRRRLVQAHQPRQPDRRPGARRDRHLGGDLQRLHVVAAARPAAPQGRHVPDPARGDRRRDDLSPPRGRLRHHLATRCGSRRRARRAALLADGARRRVPAVRRRRRGLVLTDLDLDGARLLPEAPAELGVRLGEEVVRRPRRRPRRADDLRPRVRRHGQLALQHGLRRALHGARLRDPVRVPARPRAADPRGHPRGHVRSRSRAASCPALRSARATGTSWWSSGSPPPATSWSTTRRRGPAPASVAPTTGVSSRTSGSSATRRAAACAARAAWPT